MVRYSPSLSPTLTGLCSEYNHVRNNAGECILVPGAIPLPSDDSCPEGAEFWYERTPYRKIPKSGCEGGGRPDRGAEHVCPGFGAHSTGFWLTILFMPFGFTALVALWYYRRSGYRRGYVNYFNYLWITSPDIDSLLALSAYPIDMPSLIPVRFQLSSRSRGSLWVLPESHGATLNGYLSSLDPSSAQGEDIDMYRWMKMRKSCASMTRIRPLRIRPSLLWWICGNILLVQDSSHPCPYSSCGDHAAKGSHLARIIGGIDL